MICSNTIPNVQQTIGIFDFLDIIHAFGHGLEEWRIVDVRTDFPLVPLCFRHFQCIPTLSALADLVLHVGEHVWLHVFEHFGLHLFARRPYVSQEHIFAVLAFAQWLGFEVNVALAC